MSRYSPEVSPVQKTSQYTASLCSAVDPAGTTAAHLSKMVSPKPFDVGILKPFLSTDS